MGERVSGGEMQGGKGGWEYRWMAREIKGSQGVRRMGEERAGGQRRGRGEGGKERREGRGIGGRGEMGRAWESKVCAGCLV